MSAEFFEFKRDSLTRFCQRGTGALSLTGMLTQSASGILCRLGGEADAVLARGLGFVHGRVGGGDELLRRLRVGWEGGDAEGGREPQPKRTSARELVAGDALADALGHLQSHLKEIGRAHV